MEALQPMAEGQPAKRPLPPDFSKKSFAQMFATDPQKQLLEFPLSVHRGEVAIKISAAAIDKLAIPFKHALVGKFSQGRPSLDDTRKMLSKMDLKGALDVGLIDYRHVLLRFHSEADFHRIWTRGIWQIGKYPMRVFKWSSSFQTSKETSIVPVWFELPGLPFHLFDNGVLFSIMRAVGVPLSVDAATLNLARPSVARVNVEIDLLREMPSRIWIEHGDDGEGFWQRIIPENLPLYCISCFRQGHSHEVCNMHENRVQKNWKPKAPKAVTTNPSTTVAATVFTPLRLENDPSLDLAAAPFVESTTNLSFEAGEKTTDVHGAASSDKQKHKAPNALNTKPSQTVAKPLLLDIDPFMDIDAAIIEETATNPCLGAGEMTEDVHGASKMLQEYSPVAAGPNVSVEFVRDSGHHRIPPSWKEENQRKAAGHYVLAEPIFGNGDKLESRNVAAPFVLADPTIEDGVKLDFLRDQSVLSGNKVSTNLEGNLSLVSNNLAATNFIQRECASSYTLPRTESAPLLRIHWLDKESPEPEIPDIVAQGKSLYLEEGQGDNTMVKVQFQEQVTSQIIQAKTPVKTSRYNLRSLSKAEISEIQNSKKKKKKEARRNALEFNYSDSDTHIDVDETEMNMGFYGGGFDS